MEIDNFRIFDNWFKKLKGREDSYFIQILQRQKDGVNLPSITTKFDINQFQNRLISNHIDIYKK